MPVEQRNREIRKAHYWYSCISSCAGGQCPHRAGRPKFWDGVRVAADARARAESGDSKTPLQMFLPGLAVTGVHARTSTGSVMVQKNGAYIGANIFALLRTAMGGTEAYVAGDGSDERGDAWSVRSARVDPVRS